MRNLLACAVLSLTAVLTHAAEPSPAPAKPVDVLLLGHACSRDFEPWWPKFQQACAREGVRVNILTADLKRGLGYDLYTSELLKQFQVVVFAGLLDNTSDTSVPPEAVAAFRERLDAYYRAGGSVLWVPLAFGHWGTRWNEQVGQRYDVRSLEEDLYDPPKLVDINPTLNHPLYRYLWTTNVTPHPVTAGVRGLLLPTLGEWSWPGTVPMRFGASWTVLVRGMDSTITIGNAAAPGSGKHDFKSELKGTYAAAPEIVGGRDAQEGRGRMMVLPFHTTHTWRNFNHFAFGDAMMLKGDGLHPSDGLRLFLNGCKWLAEPATRAGLGGYRPPPRNARPDLTAVDWEQAAFPGSSWSGMGSWWDDVKQLNVRMDDLEAPNARDFKGLVGARTAASDGQGSVADYVAAARKLGLSFIFFLENLEQCDEARFAKLVADCQAQSSDDFAAVPGYLYRDLSGNLHYAYNVSKLPLPSNLTAERRVIAPNDVVDQNGWANGQGLAELSKVQVNLAHLFLFTSVAPYVYDQGKLVDDGFAKYLYSEGLGHQYAPVSLTIVRSPEELPATVAAAHLTVLHAETLDVWRRYLGRNAQHPHPVYLSNGPVLKRWGALNPLGHPFWPGKDRFRLALEAESPAGLRELTIYNANTGEIYRRFDAGGAKSLAIAVDESHKQQWYLVPVVTDVNGRSAVGPGLVTYQDGNRTWMMGDRLMGMHHSMGWDDSRQRLLKYGGWLGHLWTKPYEAQGSVPPNPAAVELKIQGIDGGAVHPSAFDFDPEVVTAAGTEPKVPAMRFRDGLAAFDYAVMDYLGDTQFLENKRKKPKPGNWWETPDGEVPNQIADIVSRTWAGRGRPQATVAANVHEISVTFKSDTRLEQVRLGGLRSGKERIPVLWLLKDQAGEFAWLVNPGDAFTRRGTLPPGGYLFPANYRGGAVGLVNLGPLPLDYTCDGQRAQVFAAGGNRAVKAGERLQLRFLTFIKPWPGQTGNAWLKQYIADFGLGGSTPGYACTLRQGRLLGQNYALDVEASQGAALVEIGKYNLPHNLTLRVSGFAPNALPVRYDLERKQALLLPVFEGLTATGVNTTRGPTRLYVGEALHVDNPALRLSLVPEGTGFLLELHNPTAAPQRAILSAAPGFPPLAQYAGETLELAPGSSLKRTLPSAPGTLVATPYEGD